MQDLHCTDPAQKNHVLDTFPTVDRADYLAPARQRELDHTDDGAICLKDLDHQVGVDYLSDDLCNG